MAQARRVTLIHRRDSRGVKAHSTPTKHGHQPANIHPTNPETLGIVLPFPINQIQSIHNASPHNRPPAATPTLNDPSRLHERRNRQSNRDFAAYCAILQTPTRERSRNQRITKHRIDHTTNHSPWRRRKHIQRQFATGET